MFIKHPKLADLNTITEQLRNQYEKMSIYNWRPICNR